MLPQTPQISKSEVPEAFFLYRKNFTIYILSHMYRNMVFFLSFFNRNEISFHSFSIHIQIQYTFFHMIRIFHLDVVHGTAEFSGEGEITAIRRHAGVDAKPVIGGLYTQNGLGEIDKSPCGRAGEPAVFGFAMAGSIFSGNHL